MRNIGLLLAAALLSLLAAPAEGRPWRSARNGLGQPDLEGVWNANWATPLQRDPEVFKSVDVTEAEARAYEARESDPNQYLADLAKKYPQGAVVGSYDTGFDDWNMRLARIDGVARSALIIEPTDGRLPWSWVGWARRAAIVARARGWEAAEQRWPQERCLAGYAAGPPFLPDGSESILQIVQTRDAIVLLSENNHDARIVRLHSAHQPPQLHPWMGDSIGWWEGETLVVETTGFHPGETFHLGEGFVVSPHAKIIEQFRRVSAKEIRYTFEIDDPDTYTRPWRGEIPLTAFNKPLIEDACHEGNYDLAITLAGFRKVEADQRAAAEAFGRALKAATEASRPRPGGGIGRAP